MSLLSPIPGVLFPARLTSERRREAVKRKIGFSTHHHHQIHPSCRLTACYLLPPFHTLPPCLSYPAAFLASPQYFTHCWKHLYCRGKAGSALFHPSYEPFRFTYELTVFGFWQFITVSRNRVWLPQKHPWELGQR